MTAVASTVTLDQIYVALQNLALVQSKQGDALKSVQENVEELKNRKSTKTASKAQVPITLGALASTDGLPAGAGGGAVTANSASGSKKMAIDRYFVADPHFAKYEPSFTQTIKDRLTSEYKKDVKKSDADNEKARRKHAWKFVREDASVEGKALRAKIEADRDAAHVVTPAPVSAAPAATPAAAAAPPTGALTSDQLAALLASS